MMILNENQQLVVDKAVEWFYNSSSKLFQFDGPAGTGKSVVLNAIINALGLSREEVLPMAYTGQACTVMRKKGLIDACTCHSGLFTPILVQMKDENGRTVINEKFNTPVMKWEFIPKNFENTNIKLIVLDESWMIPRRFRSVIENTGIKVIAAGDSGQLPPVGDDPGYLVDGKIYHLTQFMRQSGDSPILYLANRARQGLKIEPGNYGKNVQVIFEDELDKNIMAYNTVLCAKNKTRDIINRYIRESIFRFGEFPNTGEKIICRKNDWSLEVDGISLVNGLVGHIASPVDIGRYSGDTIKIDFQPDMINKPFRDIYINYRYLKGSVQERETLKRNPYLDGELFEYAYASTVHLSQGSEYSSGIYIEEYFRQDMQNALNYTAITRFKEGLLYVKKRPKWYYKNGGVNYGN